MDFASLIAENVTKFIQHHPMAAVAAGSVLASIPLIRVWCKLSAGKCALMPNLNGKTVIITGANTGIGRVTAEELAKCGARVIMACRNLERGQKAYEEMITSCKVPRKNLVLKQLDLCSFASVRTFAKDILLNEKKVHILINNAGISGSVTKVITDDGCEEVMQSNFFGHFLLTNLLLGKLRNSAPCRIINVSSMMYKYGKFEIEDLNSRYSVYRCTTAYAKSKMAMVLFTRELAERMLGTGVTVNCLHPGVVDTDITRGATGLYRLFISSLMYIVGKTPREGAQTTLHLAVSPEFNSVTGKYFEDCVEVPLVAFALDSLNSRRLWVASSKECGLYKSD